MRRGLTLRMVVASGLLAIVVGASFLILLLAITSLRESTQQRRETREGLIAADQLEKLVLDLETGLRGFVITGEERFLGPWNEARPAFPDAARALERLVADDPAQLARARRIARAGASYIREYAAPLIGAVRRNDGSARSLAITEEGKRRVDALRAEFDGFTATSRAVLTAREADADRAGRRASLAGAIGLAGSIFLILLFTGYLTRVIIRPVRRAALMADRLAGGDLRARVPEGDVGEIGTLERSFNEMAGSLEANQDELRRLLEQQSALRRVATLVAQAVSPSEVFEVVTREIGLLSGADLARMERYETDGTVTGVAGWSRDADQLGVGMRFALEGVSIAALVRQTAGPVRVDSFADAAGPIAQEARELGIRSSVGGPIVVAGRLWGVIAASSKREEPFPADTESQIADFTELVATAIANAEAREELRRVADEQAALRRVATLVARAAPPSDVFSAVAEELAKLLGADITKVLRYDADGTAAIVGGWSVPGMHIPIGTRLTVEGEGVAGSVRSTGRPARNERFEGPPGSVAACFQNVGAQSGVGGPIIVEGRLWGVAIAAARGEPLPADSEERLAGFTELVATAIANAEAQGELTASRARIVAAADETRRRIERDLHDGAQQRLVSLALTLRAAQASVPPELAELQGELDRVAFGLTNALDELREYARGIHPAILGEGGLGPALKTLARRSAVPVELELNVDADARLPETIEVGAYYVVSEALTNAAKHAHASAVAVDVEAVDGVLRVAVRDDGRGGAHFAGGTGLVGLKDRVEALGGRLSVDSRPGAGTSIQVELPLRDGVNPG